MSTNRDRIVEAAERIYQHVVLNVLKRRCFRKKNSDIFNTILNPGEIAQGVKQKCRKNVLSSTQNLSNIYGILECLVVSLEYDPIAVAMINSREFFKCFLLFLLFSPVIAHL